MTPESTPSISIRAAGLNDLQAVYEFLCDLEDFTLDKEQFEQVFQQNLTNPHIYYLIAEWADQAVGFVSCHVQYILHHTGKVGEIQELYVKPAYRNQRIGQALVAALDTLARQEGIVNLEVTTNQKRTDTVRFYEREHFLRTHYKLVKQIQP